MMNPEVKAKWIAALRSGNYKQTQYHLRDDYGYCCLGVLCDIYASEHQDAEWVDVTDTYKQSTVKPENQKEQVFEILNNTENLPEVIQNWAAKDVLFYVDINSPDATYKLPRQSLQNLNDSFRYDFNKIADLIEQQL